MSSEEQPPPSERFTQRLEDFSKELDQVVQHTRDISEEEVQSIGASVDRIIKKTTSYIGETKKRVSENSAEFHAVSQKMYDLNTALGEQHHKIVDAVQQARGINDAGVEIRSVASKTHILALNAAIEASRVGESAEPFEVIAKEIRDLNQRVETMSYEIEDLAQKLGKLLPSIGDDSKVIQDSFGEFQGTIANSVRRVSRDDSEQVEAIVREGYEALSHLQFQDPMVQRLERIAAALHDILQASDDDDDTDGSATPVESGDYGDCVPGEVMLF